MEMPDVINQSLLEGYYYATCRSASLKKVDVAEAPQLENFGSKIKGKSFPFSLPHGLKLQKPINPMATVLEPGHVPDPRNPRLKI